MSTKMMCATGALVGSVCVNSFGFQATFRDTEFADPDWSLSVFQYGGGGFVTGGQDSSGGNPGNHRDVTDTVTYDGTYSGVIGFHKSLPSVYDPGVSGAIEFIEYSLDFANTNDGGCGIGGDGQAFGLVLEQGGNVFDAFKHLTLTSTSWASTGVVRINTRDFRWWSDRVVHPVFSANGGPLTLGFGTANSGSTNYCKSAGYDNWTVDVHITPLSLDASPRVVSAGQALTLTTSGGDVGAMNLLSLVDLNGTPTFIRVSIGRFDAQGEHVVTGTVPPGLAGIEATFGSLGFAKLSLRFSNQEVVNFQ